jgi:hypothetical protein
MNALVVAAVVVVGHKGLDLGFRIAREDAVLSVALLLATQHRKSNPRLALRPIHCFWLPHPSGDDWDRGT